MTVLALQDLRISYRTRRGTARAVDGVSISLDDGDSLGLVGESGCGKSTIVKAILGILPPNGSYAGGSITFRGRDLITMTRRDRREILWRDIALIPQSAMHSLDPVYRIGDQIVEAIQAHDKAATRASALERAGALFRLVGLDERRLGDYAHQFSGGMRQRAMIAMAMALSPAVIVADEPTTALDVVVQDQILARLAAIRAGNKSALLLITHDIAVVAENCNKVAVMYAGKVMEYGSRALLFEPSHPYTIGLVNAFPDLRDGRRDPIGIPGSPPDLVDPPAGCRFHARCPFATARCATEEPRLHPVPGSEVQAACHYLEEAARFRIEGRAETTWRAEPAAP